MNIIGNGPYCVYAHINRVNGKMYIGQTKMIPKYRWGKNGIGYKKSRLFYNAIKKYGWDSFEHEIIASNLTKEEADNFEELLIEKLHTTNSNYGYNISPGGDKNRTLFNKNGVLSSKHHNKQDELVCLCQYDKTGCLIQVYDNFNDAAKNAKTTTQLLKRCLCGRTKSAGGFMWRIIDDGNIKNKIERYKNYNEKDIEQMVLKKSHIKKRKGCAVYQYDLNKKLIKTWDSMLDAATTLKINKNGIWKCCHNIEGRKTAGGFIWSLVDNNTTNL